MKKKKRNNFDLTQLQEGDKILWNDRKEHAVVQSVIEPYSDHYNEDMQKETLVKVKTVRGATYNLRQSVKSGDQVTGSGGRKEPLRYVEVIEK